jgi:hypothetical protein
MNGSLARVFPALVGLALVAGSLALSCSHTTEKPPGQAAPSQAPQGPLGRRTGDPIAAFETVRVVLQSPRCMNCHPAGDAPLQGDDSHIHLQNIQRGPEGNGVAGLGCSACHGKANLPDSYGAHMPPGVATGWHLPPAEMKMVFAHLDSRALCEQLKDPAQNGGKDVAALVDHVSKDPLVLWGWSPGHGRTPVPVAHAEFVSAFRTWADAGAPCPAR